MAKKFILLGILILILIGVYLSLDIKEGAFEYAMTLRVPKVVGIIIASISIGVSTLIFQLILSNRILTPGILGITPLFILVQTVIVFFLGTTNILVVNKTLNFLLALGIMLIFSLTIYRYLFIIHGKNLFLILLMGSVLGTFFKSLSGFFQRIIDPNDFLTLQSKLFASLQNINTEILLIGGIILIGLLIILYRDLRYLDVLALGKDMAINLGVPYDALVRRLLFILITLTSLSTAIIGPVTFLGFLVTNLTYELIKTYKSIYLITGTILIGVVTMLLGQVVVEHLLNYSVALSSIINFIGGVYFLWIILKKETH